MDFAERRATELVGPLSGIFRNRLAASLAAVSSRGF